MRDDEDSRDTQPPSAPVRERPPTLPPPPAEDAPATLETLLAEIRYSRKVTAHVVHLQHVLTDRVNEMIPASDRLGGRVREIERSLGAASHALRQSERHELVLPTNGNGNGLGS